MTPFCECNEDGWCPRYNREQRGRFREICAGINCDLGTAAAFRAEWARESPTQPFSLEPPAKLLLKTDQAPGDAVAMTAAIYSLHRAHPGKYLTAVESYWPEIFAYNPDVYARFIPGAEHPEMGSLHMHYPAIHDSNRRGIHFMQGWCEFLTSALGVDVPLACNRPQLFFMERAGPIGDYWIICSGGKRDFTNKLWGRDNYQSVVKRLAGKVKFLQVGGAKPHVPWATACQEDSHPRLNGTVNMVGKTTLRELFDVVRHARGVLCGVSLLMHVAAALEKPAIVVAGGREPVPWNAYPKQHYVHTIGAMSCSDPQGNVGGACWRSRVVPLGDSEVLDRDTCERPVDGIPECMRIITPEEVAALVLRYNR